MVARASHRTNPGKRTGPTLLRGILLSWLLTRSSEKPYRASYIAILFVEPNGDRVLVVRRLLLEKTRRYSKRLRRRFITRSITGVSKDIRLLHRFAQYKLHEAITSEAFLVLHGKPPTPGVPREAVSTCCERCGWILPNIVFPRNMVRYIPRPRDACYGRAGSN